MKNVYARINDESRWHFQTTRLFENANVIHRLFGHKHSSLDQVFDHLADFLEKHMPISVLKSLIEE